MIYAASVAQDEKPDSPWVLLLAGLAVSAIGGVAIPLGITAVTLIGVVIAIVGAALTAVGVVAVGVEMGMNRHRWDQRR